MTDYPDEAEDYEPDDEIPGECAACEGSGVVMTCIDDTCRALGECAYPPVTAGCYGPCRECRF